MNGKIRYVKAWKMLDNKRFIEGNIYDVINGKIILPDRSESNGTYNTIEHINECFILCLRRV